VTRRRRVMLIAFVVSVGVHLALALFVVLLPSVLPKEAQPEEQGTVELLMVEQKGAQPRDAGQPKKSEPAPRPSETAARPKAENQKHGTEVPAPETVPAPAASEDGDEPIPPPPNQSPHRVAQEVAQPTANPNEEEPSAVRPQEVPVFDFAGTESESNAIASGERILPAMKDDRFRNRPPVYPVEADVRGEHGTVVVVIHVSENGIAAGADVLESSGYDLLDQAAVTAVRSWHFHPAMKEGRGVPFDMPFRFIFESY
jgi:protein TonB